ncbi:MAG: sigma-54 dependent transcriptional regulator [Deltaproteobacteria bacterium]
MIVPRVLIVDDKASNLKLFAEILSDGSDVSTADSGERALAMLELGDFDVLVTDIRMPRMDGFTLLAEAKRLRPDVEVILMTAYGSIPKAVEAMKNGAYNYLTKPVDPDELTVVVRQAVERRRLRVQADSLRAGRTHFGRLVGNSPAMEKVFHLMERAARSDVTVLVSGESGTGKELVARGIHEHSPRRARPFLPINCGAIPEPLLESELFGHEKGAFTGANEARRGLFEEAEKGTLFLDEMGELPLALQVKLNRALQEHAVRRVGGTGERKFDVRIIAATNLDLEEEVKAGRFREDLFYRLNVFPIRVPPLRERPGDIPLLAAALLERHREERIEGFTAEALDELVRRPWRGNVRELENAVERAVAVCESDRIGVADLPDPTAGSASAASAVVTSLPFRDAVDLARDRASRHYLMELMREFAGNVTRASDHAGVERESLHRLLKRHGVDPKDFR